MKKREDLIWPLALSIVLIGFLLIPTWWLWNGCMPRMMSMLGTDIG
ncbi:hypothetical protein KEJ34_05225 [Candidatus Bathyarchaeota archaeon]|nr:hypothetical protein [Candidatus Bathyarchaeota archaeon]